MRICMLISTPLPAREGIGFYAWNLAQQLRAQGHSVHIITRGERGKPGHEQVAGVTIWRPTFWPLYPFHVDVHSMFVAKVLRMLEPELDVVHLHTPLVKLPPTTLPVLVTVHTPMKTDAAAIPADTLLGWLVKLQAPFSVRLEQQLLARATTITAVAHSVADELAAYSIQPDTVAVLGNGVDTDLFHPAAVQPAAQPYFFTAGRLAPRKGLEDLLACAELVVAQQPAYRFLIAGAGPLERQLRQEVQRRGLQAHVQLLGHISDRQRLAELYRGASAYVHPAHYEGLPTVLLEAMACGTPVVATAISGALDVLDGSNGLLVPVRQPHQLAAALLKLIAQPNLRQQLGAQAVATIRARYAWSSVSQSYLRHYQSIIKERSV